MIWPPRHAPPEFGLSPKAARIGCFPPPGEHAPEPIADTFPNLRSAFELLRIATERFSPPANRHHALTLNDDGNPILTLHLGAKWQAFALDPSDYDRAPAAIVDDIATMLAQRATERT